ncbi:MAG: AI-2E family transporter [Paraclostridium sp.]
MISKDNIKYYILLVFISILIFKAIDSPYKFISGIGGFAKFFSPFLLGILIALLINPMMMYIERAFKLHRLLNIFISYIIVFILLAASLKLIIPSLVNTLNTIISEVPNYVDSVNSPLGNYISKSDMLENVVPHLQANIDSILKNIVNMLSKISSDLLTYVFSITSILINLIMGIILSIYMLYDKEKIATGCKRLLYSSLSRKRASSIIQFTKMSHDIFYNYIIGKLIDSLIIGVIAFIGFKFIVRIENSLFLAFIIFLTNIIPYFGPFIGAVFPILMTLVYSPVKAVWVAIFILILQQVDGNIIGPKVMGDQVGLSPLWIISAVLIGGSLFGLVGVFLSVPIAAIIKVCIEKYINNNLYRKI